MIAVYVPETDMIITKRFKKDPDAYFVSFASFPFGSIESSGSRFGMIFNPWLRERYQFSKASVRSIWKATAIKKCYFLGNGGAWT